MVIGYELFFFSFRFLEPEPYTESIWEIMKKCQKNAT